MQLLTLNFKLHSLRRRCNLLARVFRCNWSKCSFQTTFWSFWSPIKYRSLGDMAKTMICKWTVLSNLKFSPFNFNSRLNFRTTYDALAYRSSLSSAILHWIFQVPKSDSLITFIPSLSISILLDKTDHPVSHVLIIYTSNLTFNC